MAHWRSPGRRTPQAGAPGCCGTARSPPRSLTAWDPQGQPGPLTRRAVDGDLPVERADAVDDVGQAPGGLAAWRDAPGAVVGNLHVHLCFPDADRDRRAVRPSVFDHVRERLAGHEVNG